MELLCSMQLTLCHGYDPMTLYLNFPQERPGNRKRVIAKTVIRKTNAVVLLSVLKEQTYFFASSCICSTCCFNA